MEDVKKEDANENEGAYEVEKEGDADPVDPVVVMVKQCAIHQFIKSEHEAIANSVKINPISQSDVCCGWSHHI